MNLRNACINSGPNIFGKQFGAGLSVAVFAGERTAVADDKIGSLFHELAELGDSIFGLQVEIEAGVHAGVAEVAVKRSFVTEGAHHIAQVAKIAAEFFGSDGGIFPAFPVERLAGDVRGDAETGLANIPDALGLRARVKADVGRAGAAVECVNQAVGLRLRLVRVCPPNSTSSQPSPSGSNASPSELMPFVRV